MLLAGISFLLAVHSLVVSNFLPSSVFFVMSFCWLWVGLSALFDRLEAARAMASTAIAILLVVLVFMQVTAQGSGDLRAFYFLAMLPALTAWTCVYVFARHLQRKDDITGVDLDAWFEEQEAARSDLSARSGELGRSVSEAMVRGISHDNGRSTRQVTSRAQPKLKMVG